MNCPLIKALSFGNTLKRLLSNSVKSQCSRFCSWRSHLPCQFLQLTSRHFLSSSTYLKSDEKTNAKKRTEEYITMIDMDNNLKFTTLLEATKLSTRRGLKLIKVTDYDVKRQTPVYKIMTGAQYLKDDINIKKSKARDKNLKTEKIMSLSNRITDHDLSSKIQHICKWLGKNCEVRVTITGSEPNNKLSDEVFKKVEVAMKDVGRILQKRVSGTDIKFQVIPPKEKGDDKLCKNKE